LFDLRADLQEEIARLRETKDDLERQVDALRSQIELLKTRQVSVVRDENPGEDPRGIDGSNPQAGVPKGEEKSMKVVSIINYKGGVGKTTITSNLAAYLASKGKQVLMIDLDPQTNLTLSFMTNEKWIESYGERKTLRNFFQPIINGAGSTTSLSSLVIPLKIQDVAMDIVSSHLDLISVDTDLAACLGGGNEQILKYNFLTVHNHLRKAIKELEGHYDVVLIDCPPSFNTVVKNALTASDFYLVPAKMDYLSTLGIDQLHRNSNAYVEKHNNFVDEIGEPFTKISPKTLGVVPTMLSLYGEAPIATHQRYLNQVGVGYYLFPGLKDSPTIYAPAPNDGIPVYLAHSTNRAFPSVIAEITDLSEEFISKAGL
jgi:chromosome partitioning protein